MHYTDGRAVKPVPFELDSAGDPIKRGGAAATKAKIDELDEKIDIYHQKNSLVKQQLFSMITDRLLLHIQKLDKASKRFAPSTKARASLYKSTCDVGYKILDAMKEEM
ncbi:hypothetical protein K503DRAFT_811561 [Rhizopogon vinicolor AM-OR11-026]|uniref:Uncharacterized protein n=1 Tax=Rhizopogon vinicolor AM-OR11-026 TaxID=1314800 RepID=A0A1B7MG97_9AGAM|nr:hypothetical protein K503DRAFT_811561 [Rhizopogon vinicolor AM-OR11-026]